VTRTPLVSCTLLAQLLLASLGCAGRPAVEPAPAVVEEPAAMVSPRENWTDVRARVLRRVPTERPGFVALELEIETLQAVQGFLSLPRSAAGATFVLLLHEETPARAALREGDVLEARVRRGLNPRQLFADERTVRKVAEREP
jgi:hypothetical protein